MLTDEKNLIFVIAIVAFTFSFLGIFLIAMAYINIRANARRQLELVKNAMDTQEKERARIARDLHDSIGQQISAIRLHLGLMTEISDKAELKASIKEKQAMMAQATDELRIITRNLMPVSIVEYGVSGVLTDLVNNLRLTNNIELLLSNNDPKQRYRPDFEINLFRILQELINNTIKYAEATTISIELIHGNTDLKIRYSDNGCGFEQKSVKPGLGLRNIEARTRFYRGDYLMATSPGKGIKYLLTFKNSEIEGYAE